MLTAKQIEAAELVFQGRLTVEKIAARVGVAPRTLWDWKANPEFQALVKAREAEFFARMKEHYGRGIASRERRLYRRNDRWRRLQAVIEARAKDPEMQEVPGGKTGLLVMREKSLKIDKDQCTIAREYEVDTGLLSEMRALEQDAAIELGEWKQKHEHSGAVGLDLSPVAAKLAEVLTLEELQKIRERMEQAAAEPNGAAEQPPPTGRP